MVHLQIEYLSPDALTPYDKNARKHEQTDVDAVKASIGEFDFSDPIGIWGDKNLIVEGHGRLLAAKAMGLKEVPCIRLDHLTDEQRRAYALAHNKTAELSEWDADALMAELTELSFEDIDMGEFGFDISELATAIDDDEVIEDEPPEPPAEPKSKKGDIYRLGQHRLMCGDATDSADVNALIDGNVIQLALTDPPYGISAVSGGGGYYRNGQLAEEQSAETHRRNSRGKVGGVERSDSKSYGRVGGGFGEYAS